MKKITLVILTLIVISSLKAQTAGVADTTAYLKTIEANKAFFIGKPFSVLLDSLKIPIRIFIGRPNPNNIVKEESTCFHFNLPYSFQDFAEKYLRIEWAEELDYKRSEEIFDSTDEGGEWIPAARDFYKTAIIKNIRAK